MKLRLIEIYLCLNSMKQRIYTYIRVYIILAMKSKNYKSSKQKAVGQ